MTGFVRSLWPYEKTSAVFSAEMLSISTYAPFVLISIFARTVTDQLDNKENHADVF